ncbi:hypothetical protein ACFL2O_04915 [Thermodesulfobacteriota bacterium]
MAKVKGSVFIEWAKGVRGDKSGACDKYLTDEDRKIISAPILVSSWYPFETFRRCINAVCEVFAKGNTEIIRGWSRKYAENTYKDIYKNLFSGKTDPISAMKSRQMMFKTLYDSVRMDFKEISESEYIVTFRGVEPDFKLYFLTVVWIMERSLELSGAKGLKSEFIDKSWNGASQTRVKFSWDRWDRAAA